jgi:hypothetical protein
MTKKSVLMNIKGMVKADGDKITFVADEGERSSGRHQSRDSEGSRRASRRAERSRVQRQGPDPRGESYDALAVVALASIRLETLA